MKSENVVGELDIEVNYINSVDRDHRKRFGQFFTPKSIADLMASWLKFSDLNLVLDPGVGTGVLVRSLRSAGVQSEIIAHEIDGKVINYCSYNNSKPSSFEDAYFANLNTIETSANKTKDSITKDSITKDSITKDSITKDSKTKIVKNSYSLDKNIIITGPNASGKTTLLKSTLFNIILSQQIGCGFYNSASVKIYDYIHCYINIPDTGGRDSLYQAEARQCKNILEAIENNSTKNHFCVFDELYSGTNPEEAIDSAYGYLNYLNKFNNIDYVLTTHYTKLCKKLNKQNNNFYMKVNNNANDFEYTYKIKKGISKVKGAMKVLKDLNYPENIITNMKN
jgi:dsDNA-specific endonuclease/ATPase MutS2